MYKIIKMKKTIYATLLIIVICVLGIGTYKVINKKIPNTQNISSVETFSINTIETKVKKPENLKEFDSYIEKAINVKGTLTNIKKHDEKYILTITSKNGKIASICNMQADQIDKINKLEIGEDITIKGIYKGYLIDMILLNCIII